MKTNTMRTPYFPVSRPAPPLATLDPSRPSPDTSVPSQTAAAPQPLLSVTVMDSMTLDSPALEGFKVSISPSNAKQIAKLFRDIDLQNVSNRADQDRASSLIVQGRDWVKRVEEAREFTKRPFLRICQAIDATAKQLTTGLEASLTGLKKRLALYVQTEREREERIKAQEVERLREAEESARRATVALVQVVPETMREKQAIEKAHNTIHTELVAVNNEAQRVIDAPSMTKGIALRKTYNVEVTNAREAYAVAPDLFELVLKKSAFNAAMDAQPEWVKQIPGLKVTENLQACPR